MSQAIQRLKPKNSSPPGEIFGLHWHRVLVHMNLYLMMTSSNGNNFRVTGPSCGEFTSPGEFPAQRPVTRIFDVLFDLRLNKRLVKHSWGWWFETPSCSLWRQCNVRKFMEFNYSSIPQLRWCFNWRLVQVRTSMSNYLTQRMMV